MKDEHNIILILASSKWLIPSFGVRNGINFPVLSCSSLLSGVCSSYHILGLRCFIFYFPEFKVFSLYRPEAPSKSLQGFSLCCQLIFLSIILLFTGVLHGGSTWWFVKDSFHSSIIIFKISLKVMIRQAILKN